MFSMIYSGLTGVVLIVYKMNDKKNGLYFS